MPRFDHRHGDDPVQVYEELCEVIADVIDDFETRDNPYLTLA